MENLKYPKVMRLYNTINSTNILKIAGASELQYLDRGLKFDNNTSIEVSKTFLGHSTGYFVSLNLNGPATTGNRYDALFSVEIEQMRPGIINDNPRHNINGVPISGYVSNPVVSSGVIQAATETLMLRSLMKSVTALKGVSSSEFFEGRVGYYVEESATAAVVKINGVNTTASTSNTSAALADKINAVSGILAVPVSADKVFVTSEIAGVDFTLEAGANTTLLLQGVYITGTDPIAKAEIKADSEMFVVRHQTLVSLDLSGAVTDSEAGLGFRTILADGTKNQYDVATKTASTLVAGINNGANGIKSAVIGYAIGDVVYVAGLYNLVEDLLMVKTTIESKVVFGWNSVHRGEFPSLTADLLFEQFAGFYKGLGNDVRQVQTIEGEEYVCLLITQSGSSANLTGSASGFETYKTRHELVILKSLFFGSDLWNTSMTDSGTDKNLSEVINAGPWGTVIV